MSQFRFNAKRLFVTYPQANDLTKEAIYEFFKTQLQATIVIIGQERHADTGIHFHAYVEWERPYCTRSPRFADIGPNHPNIQSVRNRAAVVNYVTKENDTFGDLGDVLGTSRKRALAECETEDDFWKTAREQYPRDYVINMEKLEYYAKKKFKQAVDPYRSEFSEFSATGELLGWVDSYLRTVGEVCF